MMLKLHLGDRYFQRVIINYEVYIDLAKLNIKLENEEHNNGRIEAIKKYTARKHYEAALVRDKHKIFPLNEIAKSFGMMLMEREKNKDLIH